MSSPVEPVEPTALAPVVARLRAAGCVAADDEAEVMLRSAPHPGVLDGWLTRREQGEPLAWIVGSTVFCGHRVAVAPGVYVPRWQSEELAVRASALLPAHGRALDLCTGAGAIAVHLAASVADAVVVATDLDPAAVACARANGVAAIVADLAAPLRDHSFDVVTVVAPYVPAGELDLLPPDVRRHEPVLALDGGADGLDLVRRATRDAARVLRPGGWLLAEIGGDQLPALGPALLAHRFVETVAWYDEDDDLRGVAARLAG
ncbi:MAG: HemK/PrmC family methyltransferase [Acidimicrobiales bacterium]